MESVPNPNYRRRLFTGSNKSQAGDNLEILVGANLDRESCFTDIICTHLCQIREQFSSSQELKKVDRGSIESVKRLNKDALDQL